MRLPSEVGTAGYGSRITKLNPKPGDSDSVSGVRIELERVTPAGSPWRPASGGREPHSCPSVVLVETRPQINTHFLFFLTFINYHDLNEHPQKGSYVPNSEAVGRCQNFEDVGPMEEQSLGKRLSLEVNIEILPHFCLSLFHFLVSIR